MSAPGTVELRFPFGDGADEVSALLRIPRDAAVLLVFAHGAGADMRHPFMERMSDKLHARRIGTLRYQFPYMERGRGRPDGQPVLFATVRAAVEAARRSAPGLRLFAGGKSMGGRMTSMAAADAALPDVAGLVFFGFPLHPAGRPGVTRAEHLRLVRLPMLFLQGTRDSLAQPVLLRPIVEELADRATLHDVADADHGFHVPKRTGRTDDDVLDELARTVADWVDTRPA